MNTQNYASLEASKGLVDAGIVLETEKVWFFSTTGWELVDRYDKHKVNKHYLPAPSMAEVWRELPAEYQTKTKHLQLQIDKIKRNDGVIVTSANYIYNDEESGCCVYKFYANENPTDAMIDLLIWVRKEKP